MRRTYARETDRVDILETKLSGLEAYNGQLVDAINNLRMQNAPNRRALSNIAMEKQRLAEGVVRHKQSTAKALDERERLVDQLRHLRDDAADERARHAEQRRSLKEKSDKLDWQGRQLMERLEDWTENDKRKQYVAMRSARVK